MPEKCVLSTKKKQNVPLTKILNKMEKNKLVKKMDVIFQLSLTDITAFVVE